MKIKDLLQGVDVLSMQGVDGNQEVRGVSCDTRTLRPGELFVAVDGTAQDGRCFCAQALEQGAAGVVCDREISCEAPAIRVGNARRALALMAANQYGHPADGMTLVGVTGTNGKTTTTYLIQQLLEALTGQSVGFIGTICAQIGEEILPSERTTPDALTIHRLLRRMADRGCRYCVMEVSSHALALDRVYGLRFAVAAFTNLTQDHLDFHGTMERYAAAKARLFGQCEQAVYNADDAWSKVILQGCPCPKSSFGVAHSADLRAEAVSLHRSSVRFTAVTNGERTAVEVPIPGSFTVYNGLTALIVCQKLGFSLAQSARILYNVRGAKGRMEVVPTPGRPYTVLIDYAHTPDALEHVLTAVRDFTPGRVVAVFGCGGDRDRTKRPRMGAIAERLADFTVLTNDNPRFEKPEAILGDIAAGMSKKSKYTIIPDRAEAIAWALDHAQAGDTICLCGKGHETYVEVRGVQYHQDEREIVAHYFESNGETP